MLAHCRARRLANTVSRPAAQKGVPIAGNGAAIAQARGFANFTSLSAVRRTVSLPSTTRTFANTPAPSTPTTPSLKPGTLTPIPSLSNLTNFPSPIVSSMPTSEEKAAQEAKDQARDLQTVRNDLRRYRDEPSPPDDIPLDLVRYWNVSFLCSLPWMLC